MLYFKVINNFLLNGRCYIAFEKGEIFFIIPNDGTSIRDTYTLLMHFINGTHAGKDFPLEQGVYSKFRDHLRKRDIILIKDTSDFE